MLLAHRHTRSAGEMMRTVGRAITRCPEPHCGGQLFVQDERRDWGYWERSLVCSLCGRESGAWARANGLTRPAVHGQGQEGHPA